MPGSVARSTDAEVRARVDVARLVDHVITPGVQPDMREAVWGRDDFLDLHHSLIEPAGIVLLATTAEPGRRRPTPDVPTPAVEETP